LPSSSWKILPALLQQPYWRPTPLFKTSWTRPMKEKPRID
jgi:hypothetical protein